MATHPGIFYGGGFGLFFFILWLAALGLGIYMFILLVKLARRGIIALDLYIEEKSRQRYDRSGPKI